MSGEKVEMRIETAPAGAEAGTPGVSKPGAQAGAKAGTPGQQSGSDAPTPAPAVTMPPSVSGGEPEAPSVSGQAATPGALARAVIWFAETFPHSRHAVIGGVCGLVIALLLFAIGIPKTLVIVVLVVAGVAVGQYLDGDPKLIRLFQSLSKRR